MSSARVLRLIVGASLALSAAAPLMAQSSPSGSGGHGADTGGGNGNCRADAERLCPGDAGGMGRFAGCLQKHLSELSQGCLDSHPAWKAEAAQEAAAAKPAAPAADWRTLSADWGKACGSRLSKVCGKGKGEGALWACVDGHWSGWSKGCRRFAAAHDPWQRQCAGEAKAFCPGLAAPKLGACMIKRAQDLKDGCGQLALDYGQAQEQAGRKASPAPAAH